MKIALVVFGTRGDVQPTLALALGLRKAGHEAFLCVPPEHEEWIASYGCPVIPFGTSVKEMIKKGSEKPGGPAKQPSVKTMKKEISNQIDKLPDIIKGSDLVIGVGLVQGVPTAAEKLNIPYRFMAFYPGIMGVPKDGPLSGRLMWGFGKWATNLTLLKLINEKRMEIGLKPIFNVWANWMGETVILASEKALIPVSDRVDFRFTQTGFMFLPSLKSIPDEVEKFLEAGEPPVFIGFGSNPVHKPERYGRMMAEVAKTTGRRLIVSKGWSAIGTIMDSENILFVDEVPYDLLFPSVAMVVHHGGIGTMAAAAKAGLPQAAFPFMADQFMNQLEMIKMGISPITTSFKKMTAENLSRVIREGLVDRSYRVKAAEIALKVNEHNGTDMTVEVIEKLA
jgi:vancomycin aglycone glucosyltransferase